MRTLVHISDLHFGRILPGILDPLVDFIGEIQPTLVAVSGDLTQRARTHEYIAAREFLQKIRFPQIVVPGNHDVPLRNPFARAFRPLTNYKRYITDDLQPFFADEEIAVAGVNTARSLTWKDGRINSRQLAKLRATLEPLSDSHIKIVVTHHPFDLPAGASGSVVGRSKLAMQTLADCGVDILLAGHFHIAHIGHTAKRYNVPGFSAVIVSSGTSTSTRGRGNPNSLNVIQIDQPQLHVSHYHWQPEQARFVCDSKERFEQVNDEWLRLE
jgi:3',5'-cyclic AMP phosphodiesterase CpdA